MDSIVGPLPATPLLIPTIPGSDFALLDQLPGFQALWAISEQLYYAVQPRFVHQASYWVVSLQVSINSYYVAHIRLNPMKCVKTALPFREIHVCIR